MKKIVFEGKLVAGSDPKVVRKNFQAQFKASEKLVNHVFSGRLVTLKKGLSDEKALLLRAKMKHAGLICRIETDLSSGEENAEQPPSTPTQGAEAKADQAQETESGAEEAKTETISSEAIFDLVALEDYRPLLIQQTEPEISIDTSYLSLAPIESEVLTEDERTPFVEREIDVSDLSVRETSNGQPLVDPVPELPQKPVNTDHLHVEANS